MQRGLLVLLCLLGVGCTSELPASDVVAYDFVFRLPPGVRYKTISIVRLADDVKPIPMDGCTATDQAPGWGTLTEHACSATLPTATPGEFTVLIGHGMPVDDPHFPAAEYYFTDAQYGRRAEPPLGQLDVYRDGFLTKTVYISGAPSGSDAMQTPNFYPPTVWDTASPCPNRFHNVRDRYGACSFLSPVMACGSVDIAYMKNYSEEVEGYPIIVAPTKPLPVLTKPGETLLVAGEFGAASGLYCSGIDIEQFQVKLEYPFDPNRATDPDPTLVLRVDSVDQTFGKLTPNGSGCPDGNCHHFLEWEGGDFNIQLPYRFTMAVVCTDCERVASGRTFKTSFTGVTTYRVGVRARYTVQLPAVAKTVTIP